MPAKTKSLENIEARMQNLDPASYRYRVLECARDFKSSWIALGQFLFTVYKDKLFKDWQYLTFEAYCAKEVGIRQATAVKVLKSYSFLEREEPSFLKAQSLEERKPSQIPGYESVNALRLAKESDKLSAREYADLREDVLDEAKEDAEVKKKVRYILKSKSRPREENDDPAQARRAAFQKLLSQLNGAKQSLAAFDVPAKITKNLDLLIESLSDYQK